jgi:hypothetical protein
MRGAAVLHQVLPETWRFQSRNNPEEFSRLSAMMQWVLCKSENGLTTSKMAAHWQTVTNILGGHQQAGMQTSLRMCAL